MKFRNHTKRLIGVLLVVFLVSAMAAGCGKEEEKPGNDTGQGGVTAETSTVEQVQDEKVSITVWGTPAGTLEGQAAGEWIEKDLVQEWNGKYPNISVGVELIPFDGINEKLTTAISSGKTPDVYIDTPGRILAYANMGAVAELDDVIPPDKLELIRKNPGIMKMVSINGKIVVMPYPTGVATLVVNKTMWEKAGAADLLPQDEYRTWTPDEFKAALKAVANKEKGEYGIALFALNEQGDQLYNNIMAGFGVKLFNDDYSRYIAAENPAAEEAMKFFQSIVDEGLCFPHPETISAVNSWEYVQQGKNGMTNGGLAHIDIIKNGIKEGSIEEPFEPILVNYPSVNKGEATLRSEIGQGCVFKGNDEKKVEWGKKFLYWMYAESELPYTALSGFDIWGNEKAWIKNSANKAEAQFLSKNLSKTSEWSIIDPGWGIVGYPEMRAVMFPEMQSMFIGRTTPKETINNISAKINEVIKKYNSEGSK